MSFLEEAEVDLKLAMLSHSAADHDRRVQRLREVFRLKSEKLCFSRGSSCGVGLGKRKEGGEKALSQTPAGRVQENLGAGSAGRQDSRFLERVLRVLGLFGSYREGVVIGGLFRR